MGMLRRRRASRCVMEPRAHWIEIVLPADRAASRGSLRIRSYRESDREAVRHICCETGFLGKPVDSIFKDRELFADLHTGPYLEYEPEWALVAENDAHIVGYLLGSVNPYFELTRLYCGMKTLRKMVLRLLAGKYRDHRRSEQFVAWLLAKGFKEQPKRPDHAAHLHFNLARGYRGRGVARRLWVTFEEALKSVGIDECYGEFHSHGRHRPEVVYARYGFQVFDRCETTLYRHDIDGPVYVVCARKSLRDQDADGAKARLARKSEARAAVLPFFRDRPRAERMRPRPRSLATAERGSVRGLPPALLRDFRRRG